MKVFRTGHSYHSRGDRQPLLGLFAAAGLAALVIATGQLFGPFAAFAAPFALALLVAALRDYRVATWITVFVLPIGPTSLVPREMLGVSPIYLVHGALLLSFSSLLLTRALRPGRLVFPSWPRSFLVYLAVFVLSGLHGAMYTDQTPDYFVALNVVTSASVGVYLQVTLLNSAVALGAAYVLSIAMCNARRPLMYLIPIFASALIFAFAVFYFALASGGSLNDLASQESREYLSRTGLHANELGLLLNTAWALALFSLFQAPGFATRAALGAVAAVLGLAVLLTFSRGAWLGSLAVIAYLLYVRRNLVLLAAALLVLPVAALLMPASVAERATHEIGSKDVDALSSGRVDEIWKPLLPEILNSPLLGSGAGSVLWSEAAKQHKILPVGHPHSAYLGALLDLGVLGTIAVLLFFRHMWRLFRQLGVSAPERLWRGFFNGAAACILLLFVQGLTDDSFLPGRTQAYLWLGYGAAVGFASRLKARERSTHRAPAAGVAANLKATS
ncbi:MAG: O-antigen ligase family protein [Massilia sp.]